MLLTEVFELEVLAKNPPYYVVKHGANVFTISEEALDFPYYPDEDKEEQWLNWLIEFSVSIQGITTELLQKNVDGIQERSQTQAPVSSSALPHATR